MSRRRFIIKEAKKKFGKNIIEEPDVIEYAIKIGIIDVFK